MMGSHEDWGTLVLRIFFGIAFLVAGLDKIFSFSMAKGMFEGLFGSLGGALIVLIIIVEVLGGLMLLLGWHTRIAAAVLAIVMVVALISTFKIGSGAHFIGTLRELLVMNTGGGNTAATLAYLAGLLSLAFSGSSYWAMKPDA